MIQNTTPNPIGSTCMLYVGGAAGAIHCPSCDSNLFSKREGGRYSCTRCQASFFATPDPDATPPAWMEAPNA